ncbi:MAG: heparinase II/III family protein [Alphaproteobacteria bacterium]
MVELNTMKGTGSGGFGGTLRTLLGRGGGAAAAKHAARLNAQEGDLVPGEAGRGNAILSNEYEFAGQAISSPEGAPWGNQGPGPAWFAALHGFGWLRDLRAVATPNARARARELVLGWIERAAGLPPAAHAPAITGARLAAWLVNQELLTRDADDAFVRRFQQSLNLQVKQLLKGYRRADDGADRLAALKGLIYSGIAMADGERRLGQALKSLDAELTRQVLPDGVHAERSPSVQLAVLRDLIDLRAVLIAAHQEPPPSLQLSIDRMAPMLRGLRHGDGGLALFNDSVEEEPWLIDRVLGQAEAKGRPLSDARHGGFQRVQAGRALLIMDAGAPPSIGRRAHAGTLSFELSVGKERMIVNCGAWRGPDSQWAHALRATAAHSTLTVDDTNSAVILDEGGIGVGPGKVEAAREESNGAIWIEARHDGYVQPFGLVHQRRLYVAADGNDIRGEDKLIRHGGSGRTGRAFAVRFHLHPEAQASLVQNGASVLLRLPGGAGWQLHAAGGTLDLNESVYAGRAGERRRTEQVVITGPVGAEETVVKWAFRRIPKG